MVRLMGLGVVVAGAYSRKLGVGLAGVGSQSVGTDGQKRQLEPVGAVRVVGFGLVVGGEHISGGAVDGFCAFGGDRDVVGSGSPGLVFDGIDPARADFGGG